MKLTNTPIIARTNAISVLIAAAMFSSSVYAAATPDKAPADAVMMDDHAAPALAVFQKKTYVLRGSVKIEHRGDRTVLVFSDDFRTKKGPDLKVFLSKNTVSDATGANAISDAVRLGALTSNTGAQEYVLPAGLNLSDYASILVHCEAFSTLWGGADILIQ